MFDDYQNGITYEKEDIIIATKPKLFLIGTINLLETIQSIKITNVEIMDTYVKIIISEQEFEVQNIEKKIAFNRYELEATMKDKVYLETYYSHQQGSVAMDETPTKIKASDLQITAWTLIEYYN
jgi:hypothetical protein